MTIPFLSVKPQSIKLKVKPTFPAQLIGGIGLVVSKANGIYTIDLNYEEIQNAAIGSGSTDFVVLWDSTTRQFFRIPLTSMLAIAQTASISTVAALPPAAGNLGRRWLVTDATVTTFASVVVGGGANAVPVYCDGASWRIG